MDTILATFFENDAEQKKEMLINFGKTFFRTNKRKLRMRDLEIYGLSYYDVYKIFGNMQKLLSLCNIPNTQRKRNATDDELKAFLKDDKKHR